MSHWYYRSRGGDAVGPITSEGLGRLVRSGRLDPGDEVRLHDETAWRPVSSLRIRSGGAPSEHVESLRARRWPAVLATIVASTLLGSVATWFVVSRSAADERVGSGDVEVSAVSAESLADDAATIAPANVQPPSSGPADTTSQLVDPNDAPAEHRRRAQYRYVARELQAGYRVIYGSDDVDGVPLDEVIANFDRAIPRIDDPVLKDVTKRARYHWNRVPESVLVFEPNNLSSVLVNLLLSQESDKMAQAWSRLLGDIHEQCWVDLERVVQEEWGAGNAVSSVASVALSQSVDGRHAFDVALECKSPRPLSDVTVRVELDRLTAGGIVNHYFFETWERGDVHDMSDDPRLIYGSALIVAATVTVWSNEGVQGAERFEFPERRAAIEEHLRLVEQIKRNREALEGALTEGQRLEGGWTLGIHSGRIGFELVRRAKALGPMSSVDQVRLYDPENPAIYRLYEGSVVWNVGDLRYELRVAGKSGGLDGNGTRAPSISDFLTNSRRVIALHGARDDFRGSDNVGFSLQLHPQSSDAATRLLTDPSQTARIANPWSATTQRLSAASIVDTPTAGKVARKAPREMRRWDTLPNPLPPVIFPTVEQISVSRNGQSLFWVNGRKLSRVAVGDRATVTSVDDVDSFTVDQNGDTLISYFSNHFRLLDAKTLKDAPIGSAKRGANVSSPGCLVATAWKDQRVIYGDSAGAIHVVSPGGERLRSFQQAGRATALLVPQGSDLLLSSTTDGDTNLWNLATGANVGQLRGTGQVVDARVSSDKSVVLTVATNRERTRWEIQTWKVQDQRRLDTVTVPDATIVAISRDWRRAIIGRRNDGRVYLWNTETAQAEHVLEGHKESPTSACFSADGAFAVTGSRDGWVIQWSLP